MRSQPMTVRTQRPQIRQIMRIIHSPSVDVIDIQLTQIIGNEPASLAPITLVPSICVAGPTTLSPFRSTFSSPTFHRFDLASADPPLASGPPTDRRLRSTNRTSSDASSRIHSTYAMSTRAQSSAHHSRGTWIFTTIERKLTHMRPPHRSLQDPVGHPSRPGLSFRTQVTLVACSTSIQGT